MTQQQILLDDLAKKIAQLLLDFYAHSGLKVASINVDTYSDENRKLEDVAVMVLAELEGMASVVTED